MVRPKNFIHQCHVLEFDDEVLDGQVQGFYPSMQLVRI